MLQYLPDVPDDERESIANEYLSRPSHALTSDEIRDIWTKVDTVLNDPELSPVFQANSRAEVPLTGIIKDQVVRGQIDRLVVEESRVLIVDYKSNRPPAKDINQIPNDYIAQMAVYRQLIEKIYPNHQVICALLWTEEARLMKIPNHVLDDFAFET